MPGVASVAPSAYINSHIHDYEFDGVECTGVNVPGVYSTFQTGGDENEAPDEPVEEESRSPSPQPVLPPANADNTGLCLVTQENFAVATCSVFQLPSDGDESFRLAHAWGFQSVESLDFHLQQSSFNWITYFISKFGSIYGGHWALVPQVDTLDRIYRLVTTRPQNQPSNYLDEFPNQMWTYQYIPLRGDKDKDKLLRLVPGATDEDGTISCTVHSFPFQRLQLQSTVHPYFATANAAQRAIYALGGRSYIPQLPAEQRKSLITGG